LITSAKDVIQNIARKEYGVTHGFGKSSMHRFGQCTPNAATENLEKVQRKSNESDKRVRKWDLSADTDRTGGAWPEKEMSEGENMAMGCKNTKGWWKRKSVIYSSSSW